ncbi:ChbG/HpnK family deacetylase [Paenibacillus rhizovicinus]|uniref:ChbG/HpnK family deacetylase n=1 Tax=Paenibacillus rhizovicinus TaxID=2704463 RepID=A0A6C0P2V3_9BACL|nr:ChbG/HpnK family deacetylase [Paenibacillus rhizovicinus]QHW32785.1 ChbG/HpnK family deacetylase [Paenibacillus rhizovicinus]
MHPLNERIRLITRADDAGSARTADRAILETIERGIVRNVSVMAVGPSIEHAAELLASKQEVCFGIHATLNAEWTDVRWGPAAPASSVPSLVEPGSGMFKQTPQAFLQHPPSVEDVLTELQAQLERVRSLGFTIGYADQHMVFEWAMPQIAEPFDRWCEREGIRNFRRYGQPLPQAANADGEVHADGEVQQRDPVAAFIARLESAPPGQYLIVGHPGYDDAEMRRMGSPDYPSERVVSDRINERLIYTHPDVLACCERLGIVPIRYDEALLLKA